jgi:hypothetical protein
MYCFSGCTQSISFVCLRGQDIIGACTILTSYAEGHAQKGGFLNDAGKAPQIMKQAVCAFSCLTPRGRAS